MKSKDTLKLILSYTICFIVMFLGILFMFSYYDKSFLYDYDGLGQHIITLKTFRNMILNFLQTGILNTYSFNIGLGMDLFANYAFYSFGDPLSYLSIFVKEENLVMFYSIINIIRFYIVGLSFIAYTKYKKIKNNFAILLGSLIYTFSTFNISEFTLQPFFINAVIMFPLLMIGIDKCILENKYKFLIVIEFLLFVSQYYFAVLLSICGVVYGLIQIICTYKKEGYKKVLKVIFRLGICMLLGVLLSFFILFPTASLFLDSGRTLKGISYGYAPIHYQSIFLSLITNVNTNEGYLGTILVGVILFFLSFKEFKKYKPYILYVIFMFVPFLIPKIGSMFSLGSYPLLRFSFTIPFMIAFISSKFLDNKFNLKNIKLPLIAMGSYFMITFIVMFITKKMFTFRYFHIEILYTSLIVILIYIIVLKLKDKKLIKENMFKILTILLIIINSCVYTYCLYAENVNNHQSYFINKNANEYLETNNHSQNNFKEAVNYLKEKDSSFYRVSFDEGLNNIGLYYDINTISAYYSILPTYLDKLTYDMDSFNYQTNHMDNLDNRSKLLSLLNVKYFITDSNEIPYGFSKCHEIEGTKIYINDNYLDYASLYYSYITDSEFNEYNSIEKEESLLNSVVLNEKDINENYVYYDNTLNNIEEVHYNIIDNKMYTINGFEVNESDDYLTININSKLKGEYYLLIEDLEFSEPTGFTSEGFRELYKEYFTITVSTSSKSLAKDYFSLETMPYISYTKDYLLKLGSFDGYSDTLKIELDKLGKYTFNDIKVLVTTFDDINKQRESLMSSNFEITKVENNTLEAKVNAFNEGVLVFSTTYSDNYKVFVDDKEVDTFVANNYFLGINLDSGSHKIVLVNKTPRKTIGLIISIITLIILILNKKVFKIKL